MSKKPYKSKLNAISNIKEDVVKKELPVEVVEAVLFPEQTVIEEITQEAPAPQVEDIVIEEVISEPESAPVPLYQVHIDHPSKRYREEPSLSSPVVGHITDCGIYNVYEESGDWIKLDNGFWTMRQFTSKIKSKNSSLKI